MISALVVLLSLSAVNPPLPAMAVALPAYPQYVLSVPVTAVVRPVVVGTAVCPRGGCSMPVIITGPPRGPVASTLRWLWRGPQPRAAVLIP